LVSLQAVSETRGASTRCGPQGQDSYLRLREDIQAILRKFRLFFAPARTPTGAPKQHGIPPGKSLSFAHRPCSLCSRGPRSPKYAKEKTMKLADEIASLRNCSVAELRLRYAEVFGEATRVGHKTWLVKRIAWRLQALAEGDLSERARQRAHELANDADLRLSPPKTPRRPTTHPAAAAEPGGADERLPAPGAVLARTYKGQQLHVTVLGRGFEYEGVIYRSLSAVAKAVTGSHCNGFFFFGLAAKEDRA